MKSFEEQCDLALSLLNRISAKYDLDEYEKRAIQYMVIRVQNFNRKNALSAKHRGELSRMVQEFDPRKLGADLGALLISIEKLYFDSSQKA